MAAKVSAWLEVIIDVVIAAYIYQEYRFRNVLTQFFIAL